MDPRDVQGVAETRKEHHAHAEQGNGPAAVAPDGKQRHPSHGKHDGAGRDHGKLLVEKGDHEQHDHNGVQELDGGGDAARHVVQAVKKQQRGRRIHEAHARQLAQVDRAGVEAFPPQHEHAPERQRRDKKSVEQHRSRGNSVVDQRQSEQRDQPERRGRKQSQKKAHECLPIPAACRQAPSRTLRFRAKPPVRAGRLRPVLPYQHWAQGTMASFPLFLALSCSPFAPLLSAPRASGKKEGRENPGLLAVSKERFLGKKCQGYPGMTGSGGFRSGGMRRITPNCLSSLVQLRNQQRSPLRLPQR